MIAFEQKPGKVLADVCSEVVLLLKLNNEPVRVAFTDGTIVMANPGDSAWTIERAYFAGSRKSNGFKNPIARTPYAE